MGNWVIRLGAAVALLIGLMNVAHAVYVDGNPLSYTDPEGLVKEIRNPRDFVTLEGGAGMGGGGGGGGLGLGGGARASGSLSPGRAGGSSNLPPDSALVCRGGACRAESFTNGSGVGRSADGTLNGVSTQCKPGATVDELTGAFKHNQVGVTTAGEIRASGGRLTLDGRPGNPNHATLDGLTPAQLERLFTPTISNPVPPNMRR